jgi:hypothetical protein
MTDAVCCSRLDSLSWLLEPGWLSVARALEATMEADVVSFIIIKKYYKYVFVMYNCVSGARFTNF